MEIEHYLKMFLLNLQKVTVIGVWCNGAGKSTFLKILAGEIEPNKGKLLLNLIKDYLF